MRETTSIWSRIRRRHWRFALGFTRVFVSILGCLIPDQTKDSAYNIGDNKLIGLGLYQPATSPGDICEKAFDILPFGSGHDLEKNVGGCDGTGFRTHDLSSLEKTVLVEGEAQNVKKVCFFPVCLLW